MKLHCVVFFSLALLATGCASSAQKPRPRPKTPGERRAEIERLSAEISDLRQKVGMPAIAREVEPGDDVGAPDGEDGIDEAPIAPEPSRETAPASAGARGSRRSRCKDICRISEAICDNAKAICQLAEELDHEAWADEKCESARISCRDASARCDQC